MKLVTVAQMKSIEAASDAAGHSYDAMMDRAGSAVAQVVQQRMEVVGKRVLILVGSGNNGGDGLVAAAHLRRAGAEVACYLLKPRDDARVEAARDAGAFIAAMPDDRGLRVLRLRSASADVVIDALFGTGARLPLLSEAQKLMSAVRGDLEARRDEAESLVRPSQPRSRTSVLVIAVDGPSGMDFDTGALDANALRSDISVTFANPKIGHTRFPAAGACGELVVADIGTDPALDKDVSLEMADPALIRPLLPARPAGAHKGTFGKVMVVAGSIFYVGAPALAATAAYRSGAGLVTVASPRSALSAVAARLPEATFLPLPNAMGIVSDEAVSILAERLEGYQVLLLGPGLTREKEARAFLERLLATDSATKRPIGFAPSKATTAGPGSRLSMPQLVVDADGLNILSEWDNWWKRLAPTSILTPHAGEMARLMRISIDEVESDRIESARSCARQWGHVVVLKGAFSVVADPDGRTVVLPFANPALATAGSGDVLAGAIAGLRAQGLSAMDAALCGGYLHGLAGEIVREEIGPAGATAGDLAQRIPAALRTLQGA